MFARTALRGISRAAALARPSPQMEIYNVQDDSARGSLVRFSCEGRQVQLTVIPQLGPRKTDPQDTRPQFDVARRGRTSMSPHEVAALLAVMEGRLPEAKLEGQFRNVHFKPSETSGEKGIQLSGNLTWSNNVDQIPVDLFITKGHYAGLRCFLEGALVEGFGFPLYLFPPESADERANGRTQGNTAGQRNNNNNNRGRSQRRRQNQRGQQGGQQQGGKQQQRDVNVEEQF